ncbi:MAG: Crp/Fnr family transcriptional regulator [Bacteroidetes bacterium]|nr:MAG: Crp/Fnr family transcriptional regulator [Bacteroidota bacterium]
MSPHAKIDTALLSPKLSFLQNLATVEYVTMSRGSIFYAENSGCIRVGFLVQGSVRVFKEHDSGRSITLYRLGPGDGCILSMSCALSNPIHTASAVVDEDAVIATMSVEAFNNLVHQNRAARDYVFAEFASRLADAMLLVEEVTFSKMDERIADILLEYGIRHQSNVIKITHEQLADEAGTAREVVTRLLHDFNQKGFVKLSRGNIEILDRHGLARIGN